MSELTVVVEARVGGVLAADGARLAALLREVLQQRVVALRVPAGRVVRVGTAEDHLARLRLSLVRARRRVVVEPKTVVRAAHSETTRARDRGRRLLRRHLTGAVLRGARAEAEGQEGDYGMRPSKGHCGAKPKHN